jgi:hypothetical protein
LRRLVQGQQIVIDATSIDMNASALAAAEAGAREIVSGAELAALQRELEGRVKAHTFRGSDCDGTSAGAEHFRIHGESGDQSMHSLSERGSSYASPGRMAVKCDEKGVAASTFCAVTNGAVGLGEPTSDGTTIVAVGPEVPKADCILTMGGCPSGEVVMTTAGATMTIVGATKTETITSSSQQPADDSNHEKRNGGKPDSPPAGEKKNIGKKNHSRKKGGPSGPPGGSDDSSGDDSDSDESNYRHHRRGKRRYKIDEPKFNTYPTLACQVHAWKGAFHNIVNSCSGRPDDDALAWSLEIEVEGATQGDFIDSGRFAILDRKVGAKLQSMATGELGRRITQAADNARKEKRSLRGREIAWIVINYYSVSRFGNSLHNINDLQNVRMVQYNLEQFQNNWVAVLDGMRRAPHPEDLEDIYYKAICEHKGLAEDIAHYNRQEEGSGGVRSYEYLYNRVSTYLSLTRQKLNRASLASAYAGGGQGIRNDPNRGLAAPSNEQAAPAASNDQAAADPLTSMAKQLADLTKVFSEFARVKASASGDPSQGPPKPAPQSGNKRECRDYKAGKCRKGDKCEFNHDPKVTAQCHFHKNGTGCKYGDACPFLHEAPVEVGPAVKPAKAAVARLAHSSSVITKVPAVAARHSFRNYRRIDIGTESESEPGPDDTHRYAVSDDHLKSVAAVANGNRSGASGERRWLCDTGCPFDLIGQPSIPLNSRSNAIKAKQAVTMETANGTISCDRVLQMQIIPFNENIEPYILEDSPDVLSIGRRCVDEGFSFHWEAGSLAPYFVDQFGKRITLETEAYVPYLPDSHNLLSDGQAEALGHCETSESESENDEPYTDISEDEVTNRGAAHAPPAI